MSFCVQWIEHGTNQATDFDIEDDAEAFAGDLKLRHLPAVVFEVA